MKRWIIILAVLGALIGLYAGGSYLYDDYTLKPHLVYLTSPLKIGKTLTIFYPKWFPRNRTIYLVPGRYTSTTIPDTNYVKTSTHIEATIGINWQPKDGRVLKFEYPLIGMKFEDHLDTSKYRMYANGQRSPGYIDEGDSFYFPKYSSYDYSEFILEGCDDRANMWFL